MFVCRCALVVAGGLGVCGGGVGYVGCVSWVSGSGVEGLESVLKEGHWISH
jgi:hypothetical protein